MILAGRILVERCPRCFDERSQPRHPSPARGIFLFNLVIALLFKSGTPSGNLHAANAFQSWFSIVFCPFFLASVASLARTRTELGARVDACKWNGRGRRQNSGKLKLMNNRSPCSPVCSPSELSYASQRGGTAGKPLRNKGECGYDGNDDITMTRPDVGEEGRERREAGPSLFFFLPFFLSFGDLATSFVSCYRRQMLF